MSKKRDLDSQCHSCGGFCKPAGCERENIAAMAEKNPSMPTPSRIVAWRYRPTIGDARDWRLTEVPPWEWGTTLAIEWQSLYAKHYNDGVNSADVIASLNMALSQAEAMIERQKETMRYALSAWDTTTHFKPGDGRLQEAMECLRGEAA